MKATIKHLGNSLSVLTIEADISGHLIRDKGSRKSLREMLVMDADRAITRALDQLFQDQDESALTIEAKLARDLAHGMADAARRERQGDRV